MRKIEELIIGLVIALQAIFVEGGPGDSGTLSTSGKTVVELVHGEASEEENENEGQSGLGDISGFDITPKSDLVFKILFGDQNRPQLLINLLNAIIKPRDPIKSVEIDQTELTPQLIGQKGVRLDILAKTDGGEIVNIEMQKRDERNMLERSLFYWSKLFSGQAKVGEKYENLKKTICINILNFEFYGDERYRHKLYIVEDKTKERATDLLEIHFLEIPKIREKTREEIKGDAVMSWLEFIDNPNSDKIEKDGIFKEAGKFYSECTTRDKKILELLRIQEKAVNDYNSAMLATKEEGRKEGMEEGRKEGSKEKAAEIARGMLGRGLDIGLIADCTGLTQEEIEALKKEIEAGNSPVEEVLGEE